MNIKLYPCFEYWKQFGNIWLYSDPHFQDADVQYFRKENVSDEEQIKRINSKVGKRDILIILGDIGDPEFVSKLKGYKILIKGNHDTGNANYYMFDEVYSGPVFINNKILLSHEPVSIPFGINIHGHDHGNSYIDERHINLCAELINFTPVSLKTIIESGVLSQAMSIHRIAIDRQINHKENIKQWD